MLAIQEAIFCLLGIWDAIPENATVVLLIAWFGLQSVKKARTSNLQPDWHPEQRGKEEANIASSRPCNYAILYMEIATALIRAHPRSLYVDSGVRKNIQQYRSDGCKSFHTYSHTDLYLVLVLYVSLVNSRASWPYIAVLWVISETISISSPLTKPPEKWEFWQIERDLSTLQESVWKYGNGHWNRTEEVEKQLKAGFLVVTEYPNG